MATGKIKWFNHTKGFGCIKQDEDRGDLFVHISAIPGKVYSALADGDRVTFEIVNGIKGAQAHNVRRVMSE